MDRDAGMQGCGPDDSCYISEDGALMIREDGTGTEDAADDAGKNPGNYSATRFG
jgi:hypothetical protein